MGWFDKFKPIKKEKDLKKQQTNYTSRSEDDSFANMAATVILTDSYNSNCDSSSSYSDSSSSCDSGSSGCD